MKLNIYKNYRTCPECSQNLPLTREYYRRLKLANGVEAFHHACRTCEDNIKRNHEWKDGKLLCHDCGEYKDVKYFNKHKDMKIRECHATFCTSCRVKRRKEIEPTKKDDLKLIQTLTQRYHGAKERAIKQNAAFNLTLDYLLSLWNEQNGICTLSGMQMTFERYKGRIPTNVSVDRIDKDKGYIIGNVQLVCMACNQIKSDWSEETMYNICKKIVEQHENKNNKNSTAA